jgi:hypothetical protein
MIFHGRTMAMATMNMVSAGGFSGVSFHLRRCPQEVACVLCKKTPFFGSQRSKLHNLTVVRAPIYSESLKVLKKQNVYPLLMVAQVSDLYCYIVLVK